MVSCTKSCAKNSLNGTLLTEAADPFGELWWIAQKGIPGAVEKTQLKWVGKRKAVDLRKK